jgi:hypothetical protein
MRRNEQNGWFPSSEFLRAAMAIHVAATTQHAHWLGLSRCKYVQLRIDQRTGDFIFQDGDGKMLEPDEIYQLFPSLAD